MSYILDALRRADAERSRGIVPGLNAPGMPTDPEPAARNFSPLIWAAGAAGTLLVAGVVVLVFGPWRNPSASGVVPLAPAPELNATAARDVGPTTAVQGETPALRPGGIEPAAMPVEPPIARTANFAGGAQGDPRLRAAAPPPMAPTAAARLARRDEQGRVATLEPQPAAAPVARLAPDAAPAYSPIRIPGNAPAPATSPYAAATAAAAAAAATPPPAGTVEHYGAPVAAAATTVPNQNDLASNVRAQLPRLTVGGAIYSEAPADRMLILNGQVYHQGDKPATDTVLEQIRLKSAVLNWRGQRYEITY